MKVVNAQPKLKRILFVDDEPHMLASLRRSLRTQRGTWEMCFAGSGEEALELAANTPFDAVVSDMQMPHMDGAELLRRLANRHPNTIRLVLSGQSDEAAIMKLVGTAHQFLTKPCDVGTLKDVLARAFALQNLLSDEPLQSLVKQLVSLPTMPRIYESLNRELRNPCTSIRDIGRIIAADPPMTAKLLQVVNSAFFGVGRHITNPEDAANLLGTDTLKGLLLTAGVFRQFESSCKAADAAFMERLWQHNLLVGQLARNIAAAEDCPRRVADDAMAAGLLHEIGILVLAFQAPKTWRRIKELAESDGLDLRQAELSITGTSHEAIGAYLLGLWGLPSSTVEAVAFNHTPGDAPTQEFNALIAVHVADALLCPPQPIDESCLRQLGLQHRVAAWRGLAETLTQRTLS
jgi:HD-like signal output (HDOD) protein